MADGPASDGAARVKFARSGQISGMEETTGSSTADPDGAEPEITTTVRGDVVSLTVSGEFTEAARRPLVRILTEALLSGQPLSRVELWLADVAFLNSAGLSVLVQLQKMTAPRGVELALVEPSPAVTRPLKLTGLWHRFPVLDETGDRDSAGRSSAGPGGGPPEHA